jgi:NAD(P)-dependent dehydrogenase (short-subunit alcohol dehydrogenase family)
MKNLTGKTVFITGGLSGIGNACAIAAAKFGAIFFY